MEKEPLFRKSDTVVIECVDEEEAVVAYHRGWIWADLAQTTRFTFDKAKVRRRGNRLFLRTGDLTTVWE